MDGVTCEITEVEIFFKAGVDSKCIGCCYQSQRVLMLSELKLSCGAFARLRATPVNVSKPTKVFTELGLHLRVPALFLHLKNKEHFDPIDIADDIVLELDKRFPGGVLKSDFEVNAEIVTRNFYSKFCHWMRGVAKDGCSLEAELKLMDSHLESVSEHFPSVEKLFLCGERPAQIDCEVLPILHQVRVAADGIKGYEIAHNLKFLWRYLHSAYGEPAFVKYCPSDTEILLHWLDTGSPRHQLLMLASSSGKPLPYSFSVPATATRVLLE